MLASTCRQKILETLARVEQTHMMELVRKTNSTHRQVNRNLGILEEEDMVTVKHYGRVKIIQLNRESEKTHVLLKALNILTRTSQTSKDRCS